MDRWLFDTHAPDEEVVIEAVKLLRDAAEGARPATVAVWVPAVADASALPAVLSRLDHPEPAKRRIDYAGWSVQLAHGRATQAVRRNPTLVMWADDRDMEAVDLLGPSALAVFPAVESASLTWNRTWAPTDPRTGQPVGPLVSITSPIVKAGLSGFLKIRSDLLATSDRLMATSILWALKDHGEVLVPDEIRAEAGRVWRLDRARELAELAEGVASGRTRRPRSSSLSPGAIDRWISEARV